MTEPLLLSIGVVIMDDIVLPDGEKVIGVLGGGAVHAATGMRVWADRVGLLASVPDDFDTSCYPLLHNQFILTGLKRGELSTIPRGWQIFDAEGNRSEEPQTDYREMIRAIPTPADLPEAFTRVDGMHLHCIPESVPDWVPVLRARGCRMLLWEPFDGFCTSDHLAKFLEIGRLVDVVSPNLGEAQALTGLETPEDICAFFQSSGIPTLLMRMGEKGCLLSLSDGRRYLLPAYPAEDIVDVTGAGNACCGGFVAGMILTGDPVRAGCYANISASFALRQFGALYGMDGVREEANRRLLWYADKVQQIK